MIASTGTASTAHSVELTKRPPTSGVDAALVVTPYYNRPSQAGIEAHFRAIAGAAAPARDRLRHPQAHRARGRAGNAGCGWPATACIAGVKDAAGSPAGYRRPGRPGAARLRGLQRRGLAHPAPAGRGAVGVISVASHWAGPQMSEMIAAFTKGDTEAALALNARLVESWEFQTSDDAPNPVPTKAMLRALGLPAGECRLPMGPAPEGLADRAQQVWSNLHLRPVPPAAPNGSAMAVPADGAAVRIVFLGGLGEIGRNCAWFEMDGRAVLVDCGLMFPDPEMPGVDLVLPDFTYIIENKDRLEGCVLTHGHEDHCGGLAYLLRDVSMPDLRLRAVARPGPQPHRGGRPGSTAPSSIPVTRRGDDARSARSTSSSSRWPTPCPTASPSPSTPLRASSCTRATSSST